MMKGEWIILLWMLLGIVFLLKTTPIRRLVRNVRRQPSAVQAAVALCLLVAVITGGTKPGGTNELSNSSRPEIAAPENASLIIQQSSLPSWWTHDATDTDSDGIPDLWEKWTHGNRQVADDGIDRDGDGLTELEEFQNQTDPRTADTDGDGFDDAFEVGNGMNPLVQEDFTPVEPDENENGIIDLWENEPYLYGFTDTNHNGFDDYYEAYYLDPASDDNYDVVVDVYTTRSAALTWTTTNATQGIVLAASTGTSVRLRLPFGEDTQIALVCSPTGGVEALESLPVMQLMQAQATSTNAIPELWKARIRVDYASRHAPDGPFLDDGSGRFVEIVNPTSAIIAALLPDPASSTAACGVLVESHASKVSGLVASACRVHSGPVAFVCEKTKEDHTVGYTWSSEPVGVTGDTMTNLVSVANFQTGTYEVKCTVSCKRNRWKTSRTTHAITFLNVYDCTTPPLVLSVYENEWHIPTNMAATCGTPERVYVGFDHAKVNTRNLPLITVENLDENVTDHCLGVVWEEDGDIDLFSLLGSNYMPYKDDMYFTADTLPASESSLAYGDAPNDLSPTICHIMLVYRPSGVVLDRMWFVINSPATQESFMQWVTDNANLMWTATLPRVFSTIIVSNTVPVDPESGTPNQWKRPSTVNSYMHHDAKYEIRSEPVGSHGHQATYSADGVLISSTIAAGTADMVSPAYNTSSHKYRDVHPFLRALQLDGNPVLPVPLALIPFDINRPCLYQGENTDTYISRRPILPTGVQ